MELAHSRLAPSSASRWVYCQGSVQMAEQFPDPEGEAAREGTACHWVGSETLSGRGGTPFTGRTAPNGVIITEEMVDAAKVYVEAIHSKLEGRPAPTACAIEQSVAIPRIHPECHGTPDAAFTDSRGELHVADLKYGHGIVEAHDNWQMICYVAGLLQPAHKFVNIHIIQPRAFHSMGPVRSWRIGVPTLERYFEQLRISAEAVYTGHAPVSSGSYCRYCNARHACPAAQKAALYSIEYTDRARVEQLTPEALAIELRTMQRAAAAIQYRLTGLESQAIGMLQTGALVPGFGLDRGGGRATWSKTAQEIFALGDLMGLDLRKSPEPITPAQAKKKGISDELVKAYSKTDSNGLKLVATDNTLAAQVFSALP